LINSRYQSNAKEILLYALVGKLPVIDVVNPFLTMLCFFKTRCVSYDQNRRDIETCLISRPYQNGQISSLHAVVRTRMDNNNKSQVQGDLQSPVFFVVALCFVLMLCALCSCFVHRASCSCFVLIRFFGHRPSSTKHKARMERKHTLPRRSRSRRKLGLFDVHR
jgi:hypothetical protein